MKEWKCKDCCCFESDICPYPYVQEHYNACSRVVIQHDEAYKQGRADTIDECIAKIDILEQISFGIVEVDLVKDLLEQLKENADGKSNDM